ncbi:MAG TPA: hypothetical protein VEZ72_05805 [Paenibacillus sp.]|nr:hypothetical protein [Paenibacillus sp.]
MLPNETQVNGNSMLVILNGCGAFKRQAQALLEEQGVTTAVELEEWYPLKSLLGILEGMSKKVGSNILVECGKQVTELAEFPPQIETFAQALELLNVAYHMNHRNGDIGNYLVTKTDPTTYRVDCSTVPYPAKFNFGLIRGLSNKFEALADIEEADSAGGGVFVVKL